MAQQGLNTLALHAGQQADPTTGARAVPIYQTTSYVFKSSEHAANLFALKEFGNIYTRIMNPTTDVFEKRIAALEGGTGALAVASGQSAISLALLAITRLGDEIVSANNLYGGTYQLFHYTFPKLGRKATFVDSRKPDAFKRAITDKTRAVYIETIGNPKLDVPDFDAIARIAHDAGVPLIVDNTVGVGLVRPIEHGADIVMHSATKLLGGHSDLLLGAAVCRDDAHADSLTTHRHDHGAIPGGLEAFLALRGLRTLAVRLDRAEASATELARRLASNPHVSRVNYPGLPGDPQYERALRVLPSGSGPMLSFEVAGTVEQTDAFLARLRLLTHATSLGGVESLIERRARYAGDASIVGPTLCRLSVGIENVEDLWTDLDGALRAALG
jgi:O-acetylhomoserine (thiol)-lyase